MSAAPKAVFESGSLSPLSRKPSGFTLIELLMVFAIIAILAALTFGITRGVKTAQNKAKAKTELMAISQAIEEFKARYGDYPWHDSGDSDSSAKNQTLLFALTGRMTMQLEPGGNMVVDASTINQDDSVVLKRPKFLDDSKFNTRKDSAGNTLELLDPWDQPYIYLYKQEGSPTNWEVFGFHLYATGPKGEAANDAFKSKIDDSTGVISSDFREVADAEGIIFAGE